ncbi:YesL family protein [Gracilibacillus sp. HCP3S3_G5_1]|uniref:YesL family protein n=1 Tax=unclassified Gracilibacillus TaxID=2625209 RepID=UPI003F8C1BC8
MVKTVNSNGLYRILEWIMWIMYLNLLWIVMSIAGLVVLGIFPATMALVITIREWCVQEDDISFNKTFFKAYKNNFVKANVIGYVLTVVGYILLIDFQWIIQHTSSFQSFFIVLFIVIGIIFAITLLYIFPTSAHFDLNIRQTFKHAIVLGIFSPFISIAMLVTLFLLQYLWRFIPGLLPVVGISFTFYLITRLALFAFESFEIRQQSLLEKEYVKGEKNHA